MASFQTPKQPETLREEDWFDNVENLRPLRGGRRAETLNEIASGALRYSAEDAEKKFCENFESAKLSEDPLSVMWNFSNWFEEHFPTGKHRVFYPMLYKICTTYAVEERYKNDERILKLWVKLAESFPESGLAVMEFAYTKGSCRQLSKFYIRWSEMYQAIGHLNRAREKLNLGIAMFAAPLPFLYSAIDELNAQTHIQTALKNAEEEEHNNLDANIVENCRETLGKLRGLGRRHVAPIIRITQGPPGKILKSAQKLLSAQKSSTIFDIFVDASPGPTMLQQVNSCGTPAVRQRLIDDLKDDPDYQALFGFFDDREKVDLHFSTIENSSKPSCKKIALVSTSKTKSKLRCLPNLPQPNFDFEVFSDEPEPEPANSVLEGNKKPTALIKCDTVEKAKKPPIKSRLKMKKILVMEMSIEEWYAQKLYPKKP